MIPILTLKQVLSESDKQHLIDNMAGHMKDAQEFIQKRCVANFTKCDPEYGERLQDALNKYKKVGFVVLCVM